MYTYRYPRPAVTADVVLFAGSAESPLVLLVRRRDEPFRGCWALPGGFVEERETLEACAERELAEETGVSGVALHQVRAFSDPDRDPRGRTISVAFTGWLDGPVQAKAGDDASGACWWGVEALPPLAFDHGEIIAVALDWWRLHGRGS